MTKQGTYNEACREVWETLKAIDCNEHVKEKNGLSFLSWAWAYQMVMDKFPDFNYTFDEPVWQNNGTVEVRCTAMIGHKGHVIPKQMWLAVMDHRNKAIVNPDTVAINKAKMRCLCKAISMLGLGAYIYAGEDLPSSDDSSNVVPIAPPAPPVQPPMPPPPVPPLPAAVEVSVPTLGENPPAESPDADRLNTVEDADKLTGAMIQIAQNMHSGSVGQLTEFWVLNKKTIDHLDQKWPEQYARLKAAFTAIKAQLTTPQEA